MTTLLLDVRKTLEENAETYFEKAKKARKKLKGVLAAIKRSEEELSVLSTQEARPQKIHRVEPRPLLHWYEKFRWFLSSEGLLCVGGRDAGQNETLIKKHLEPNDLVFHTELPGSPFFVVKSHGNSVGKPTKDEAAQATASYSKAWKLQLGHVEAYAVRPDQVSKTAQVGEFLAKGSFVIRGKREYASPTLNLSVGLYEGTIIGGPLNAVRHHTTQYVTILPGRQKPGEAAKEIKKLLNYAGHLDDIIRFLPPGTSAIKLHVSASQ